MAGPDPLTDARHAYDAAREAIGNYQLPQARAHLDRAKQLLSDAPGHHLELHIRVQLSESWLISDEEGLEPALAQVEDARKRAAEAGREGLQALAHIQAGVLCARAGHLEDARTHLRHAVPIAGQLPIDDRVRLLINKGTIESQTGNLSQAAADLRLAADLAEGLPEYRFMALHNLGFIQYLLGNLPGALETMLAADQMDVAVDRTVSRLDRARVLMEAGMVDEAAEVLADSVAALRSAGMTEELSDALLDQARCAMLQQDPATSGAVAAEVAEMANRRGNERRALAAEGIRIEAELLAGGSPDVLRKATRLVESAEEAGMGSLADRAAALGHLAAPADTPPPPGLPDRLQRMRKLPNLTSKLLAVRAGLRLTVGEAERSKLMDYARHELVETRSGMASLDLRTALGTHLHPIIDADLDAAIASGDPTRALSVTETWRCALDAMPSVVPVDDAELAEMHTELRLLREELRTSSEGSSKSIWDQVAQLEHRVRERAWARGGSGQVIGPTPLNEWEPRGSTIISCIWSKERLHAVVVQDGADPSLVRLGPQPQIRELTEQIAADVAALPFAPAGRLQAGITSSLKDALSKLEPLVLPSIPDKGPVVIIPSGTLARLPWGMLPSLRSRGVTLARSVSSWQHGRTSLERMPGVAVAHGPHVPSADAETGRVLDIWLRARRVTGNPTGVRDALSVSELVHVAAHGTHRADNPLFSSLLLDGGELFAHELEGRRLQSTLAVLSACSAGRSRLRHHDEALGLTASLLSLGVKAVVAPMSDVPDELALQVMTQLHLGLAAGKDGPTALAEASEDLLARTFTWFGSDWRCLPQEAA